MNRLLLALSSLVLSITVSSPLLAQEHAHAHEHAHEHAAAATELRLNDGAKWETDAPLRDAMGRIRGAMTAAHPQIHANSLPDAGYAELAEAVQAGVADMVANCRLPADADAQLHIVLGQLLSGAGAMAGTVESATRKSGAHQVFGALGNYGEYFDDPAFQPIQHMH